MNELQQTLQLNEDIDKFHELKDEIAENWKKFDDVYFDKLNSDRECFDALNYVRNRFYENDDIKELVKNNMTEMIMIVMKYPENYADRHNIVVGSKVCIEDDPILMRQARRHHRMNQQLDNYEFGLV